MTCKNCGKSIENNYCSHCGQKVNVDRIDLPYFLTEFSESFFQVDKGFFYSIKQLLVNPGISINEYLRGKRKKYFKPIAYVITLSTLYFLTTQFTDQNTWIDDAISGFMNGVKEKKENASIPEVFIWFSENYGYATLLLLPVFSLASYLSFYKFKVNYLEHIVINAYITGTQAIFYSLFTIIRIFTDAEIFEITPFFISISYHFLVFWQVFFKGNRLINILRSLMTYVLYFIFCGIIITIVFALLKME
ncbi:MAG: DUF3667 domain-containing protein [Cyclobacteriaceae bacterium]